MGFDKGTPEVPWQTWGLRYKRAGSPRTDNYELLHCPRTASRTMPPSGNRLARDRTGQPRARATLSLCAQQASQMLTLPLQCSFVVPELVFLPRELGGV
jgi:hypothetical protein